MSTGRLAAILLVVCLHLQAAERWIKLTTPHFEMYTTSRVQDATQALKIFEQVQSFFLQSNSKAVPDKPVRIIAFHSAKEYKPYRFTENSFAYYLQSRQRDYIVMQDISPEHHEAAVHEYTHLIVEHLDLKLPIWLNEGLAEFYSSLGPEGNQVVIGKPPEGRLMKLVKEKWLDLDNLFAVTQDSPYYNERQKMSIFYAQSWALTHMLQLGSEYRPGFPKFLMAIASGRSAPDCFQSIYGKSLSQVSSDLQDYIRQSTIPVALFDVTPMKSELDPEVSDLSDFQANVALTDLLASQKKTMAEATLRFSELAESHPENLEIQESLGYLAWQQGNAALAMEYFRHAYDLGSRDPGLLFNYAQFLSAAKAPNDQVVAVLTRLLSIKPNHDDALLNLGIIQMHSHKFDRAVAALSQVKVVKPESAFTLFSAWAYCDLELRNFEQARVVIEKAKQYAHSSDQTVWISKLLQRLNALEQDASFTGTLNAPEKH